MDEYYQDSFIMHTTIMVWERIGVHAHLLLLRGMLFITFYIYIMFIFSRGQHVLVKGN